jgi:hypothetical protein
MTAAHELFKAPDVNSVDYLANGIGGRRDLALSGLSDNRPGDAQARSPNSHSVVPQLRRAALNPRAPPQTRR